MSLFKKWREFEIPNKWTKHKNLTRSRRVKGVEGKIGWICKKTQRTIEELGRKNYYLGREDRVLRGLVENYKGQNRFLEGFALIVFILG